MKAYPYLIHDLASQKGERLSRLDPRQKRFDEKWLQEFLMNHPDILPTGDIEPVFYPLVPIGKEVPVVEGRIDILYLSGSGYPVIVETKLWRNPESRREVVAQILDMAFAFSKWGYDQLDEYTKRFAKTFYGQERSLISLMEEKLGEIDMEQDEFRDHVENNLNLGRFLVAVVGDKIRSSTLDILNGLNRYPGLGLELAMIELECFTFAEKEPPSLLIIPRIAKKSEIIERSIVEVKIQRGEKKPEVEISQEKTKKIGKKISRPTLTEIKFWEILKEKAPDDYHKIKEFVEGLKDDPLVEMAPGVNGLRFRRILSESDRVISLFFITTDSFFHVRLQAPILQFKSLRLDTGPVDEFGREVKLILNGFSSPFNQIDIEAFKKALSNFCEKIDGQELDKNQTRTSP
ncbi:MAG: hypothetical protein GX846_02875 [Deltaproteobacteria bacterium]|nr:hypothetical protein [Deltaproteobacteria bacterium]